MRKLAFITTLAFAFAPLGCDKQEDKKEDKKDAKKDEKKEEKDGGEDKKADGGW